MRKIMKKIGISLAIALSAGTTSWVQSADEPAQHHQHADQPAAAAAPAASGKTDARQLVKYPEDLRIHTLANMRDHLMTMGQIQEALSRGAFDRAGDLAEQQLGMSSLDLHEAHEVAKYMPKGMQDAGTTMHRSASRFAIVAKDASVTGDLKPVLAALSTLNQTCVACHAGYRLQ
jgi:hypothetical protein